MAQHLARLQNAEPWLDAGAIARLEHRIELGLRRARATGGATLVSVTSAVPAAVDPTATAAASRRPGEPWFCLEQPDRDGSALAALGSVRALETRGADRFRQTARRWRALAAAAIADEADGPPGAGLVALGGFAFASDGATARDPIEETSWSSKIASQCAPLSVVLKMPPDAAPA